MSSEADKAKFSANYDKVFDWDSFAIAKGQTKVMACDLNNFDAYRKLVGMCGTLIVLEDAEFIVQMQENCEMYRVCGMDAPNIMVCDTVADLVNVYNTKPDNTIIFYTIGEDVYNCIRDFVLEIKNVMKIDEIITNPPYAGDLHLQILDELTKISNKVVCIHPGRWVEDILAQYKGKGATGRKFEHLKKMLTKIMMIKQKDGCKMFSIGLPQDMMIGVYENGKCNSGVLPIHDDSQRFFNVLEKIVNYAHNVANLGTKCEHNKTGVSEEKMIDGIRVEIKAITPANDAKTDFGKNKPVILVGKSVIVNGYVNGIYWNMEGGKARTTKAYGQASDAPIPISIKFLANSEAKTFIDLYRSPVMKNIIHMLKYDQHSGHTHIPYFDPKTIQTEDDVLDALGITNEDYRNWLKRTVDDYREKDFIKYGEWIDC